MPCFPNSSAAGREQAFADEHRVGGDGDDDARTRPRFLEPLQHENRRADLPTDKAKSHTVFCPARAGVPGVGIRPR
jgi:hypothetical protein